MPNKPRPVVDLRQPNQDQSANQPLSEMTPAGTQSPSEAPSLSSAPATPTYQAPAAQQPIQSQTPKKGGGFKTFLMGCCIFLLLVLIGLVGLGVYYTRQAVVVLREKGTKDFVQYFDDKFGKNLEKVLQDGAREQIEKQGKQIQQQIEQEQQDQDFQIQ